jgi:signal transduction histidine kinase
MRLGLGTKLTLYLSLIIVLMLSGYGYLDILSRRDILIRKMKAEVRSTGRTLEIALEKTSQLEEMKGVQNLIDALTEQGRTLGIIVYYQGENRTFRSHSLENGTDRFSTLIQRSIRENQAQEDFGVYKKIPVFSYTFPFKDRSDRNVGAVFLLQSTSFMEDEIAQVKWNIGIIIFLLIVGTVALVLWGTRKWVSQPIAKLVTATKNLSQGNLNFRIDLPEGDEISVLAQAFNQMAEDLKKSQERLIREGETRLDLERSLRQSEKLATVGQLASGLAHEIGTPLNIIYGRAELIQRRLEDKDELKRNLAIILHQTERITRIVRQLLDMVRKKKLERRVVHISPILETTLDFLDHQIQKQKVQVVKDLQDEILPVIGDPDQILQVFLNLFLNAIQAMPSGGKLHISALSKMIFKKGLENIQRQYIEVCIEDTGLGMEKEVMENIFQPFFTGKETGTGLGLTVCQGIVQEHEGWIEVESKVGKGSVFTVYLPAFQEAVKDGKDPS